MGLDLNWGKGWWSWWLTEIFLENSTPKLRSWNKNREKKK